MTLKKEGVLEVQVNYVPPPPPSTPTPFTLPLDFTFPPDYSPPPPPASSLLSGVAYGLIWKVTYSEGGQRLSRYISQVQYWLLALNEYPCSGSCFSLQHLPFILLPNEVGPLYRIGSNMLAIRDLQCKQNMQLSFALVNVHGIGPFTRMKTQCFYGEVWLIAVHAPVWLLQWAFRRTTVSDNCPMKSLSLPFLCRKLVPYSTE